MPPDFLVIGHVVQDIVPGGWRLGGTASFASLLAVGWGMRVALLTTGNPGLDLAALLPGVEITCAATGQLTRFENIYSGAQRRQYVRSQGPILTADMLPLHWRETPVVLLGPVIGEVDTSLAQCFPAALLGVSAQGWLREVGPDGQVRPLPPRLEGTLRNASVLFVSDEDLPAEKTRETVNAWGGLVPTLCFTHGQRGAEVCHQGEWRHIDAFPAEVQDPTGAGDVFATAFLVRFHEGNDVWEATRFAACAASFVVEGEGISGLPSHSQIVARLADHPEIIPRPLL